MISQKDTCLDFIMELLDCSTGLVDITFDYKTLSETANSISDFDYLRKNIEHNNWLVKVNKKIQIEQKKMYHKISLKHRRRIALLAKYGIVSQLYILIVHNSNSILYLNNRFIYFLYQIEKDLLTYTPILSSKIYFDNLRNTHVFTDDNFYVDKNE
ncbi:MAG: hypothetical protein LBJ60_03330 [Tannerellaceae bacterium]|jgi:hypothetical protein|nr:hypothetical protein [Tannerellaceae bacterium]